MRPTYGRTALGAIFRFFTCSLLLGLVVGHLVGQTRLDTSQVAPLKGDVRGPFASTKLRDVNSAVDHGNGTTNGIASAIADCGVTVSCSIIVPPTYSMGEAVPGYQLNDSTAPPAAVTPGNIAIYDRRYSDARMLVNNLGYTVGFINTPSGWLYNYYSKAAQNANLDTLFLRQWSLDGGSNQQNAALTYANKTTWATILAKGISHTPGQHVNMTVSGQNASLGDSKPINNLASCNGGFITEGDLGCRAQDNIVAQGNTEYGGTLNGSPAAAATSLSVVPLQGQFTQGAGRFLVKTNAGAISSGTISQVTGSYNTATSVTGSGTAWPVSTAIAQLGNVLLNPGVATVTPTSFSSGSMAAIQTNSLVCVSDSESFEMVYPTAVTNTTFTANFAKIHPGGAMISTGGLCGYLLDLTADDVTNSTYPHKSQTITGTLHFAWPVIASTSATTASVWVVGGGNWQQMVTRWNAATANGYALYPFGEVISTQQSGTLSDSLTLAANNVSWNAGDTVSEFLYPATHLLFGNSIVESYYPNITGANGFSLAYNMPLQGNEAMLSLINNGPTSFYRSHGGGYGSPSAMHLSGPTTQSFTADLPADNATIGFGCATPCTATENQIAAQNSGYYDFLFYDTTNQNWIMTANSNATHYTFGANRFAVPFANVSLANDTILNGYVATQQVRSSSSANSDISGELVFSNSVSGTQILQGTYTNHPECLVRPQFDAGSTNRHWVSYGNGSFTVNFAVAVSGVVTYSCAARN